MCVQQVCSCIQFLVEITDSPADILPALSIDRFILDIVNPLLLLVTQRVEVLTLVISEVNLPQSRILDDFLSGEAQTKLRCIDNSRHV